MGGNALKNSCRRHNRDEFLIKACDVQTIINDVLNTSCSIPRFVSEKETFGDLDVCVRKSVRKNDTVDILAKEFNSKEIYRNGDVVSFEYQQLQVDVIFVDDNYFDFAVNYFSFNDFGNLLGRIARNVGFKLGFDGLHYPIRGKDHIYEHVTITRDWYIVLDLFELDTHQYSLGFLTFDQMFEYLTTSPYFSAECFALENRKHDDRMRDRKRTVYIKFLNFIEGVDYKPLKTKEDFYEAVCQRFPRFDDTVKEKYNELRIVEEGKKVFNGKIVSEITGRKDKELGELMKHIRERFDSNIVMYQFFLNMSEKERREYIAYCDVCLDLKSCVPHS